MTTLRATPWPAGEPFRDPPAGAFCFTDATDKPPRFMRLACPRCRAQSLLPIAPHAFRNGESFAWDGNREAPTLRGVIVCLEAIDGHPLGGCGWRGTMTAGELSDA